MIREEPHRPAQPLTADAYAHLPVFDDFARLTASDWVVSSIEPNDCGGQVNAGQEASRGLVVAGGNGPELLELGEEVSIRCRAL